MGVKKLLQTYTLIRNFAHKFEFSGLTELVLGEEDFDCWWVKNSTALER